MLVLSRKIGQTIEIGNEISVEVLRVQGNRVQIGIRAPKDVRILRGELPSIREFEMGDISDIFATPTDSIASPTGLLAITGSQLVAQQSGPTI